MQKLYVLVRFQTWWEYWLDTNVAGKTLKKIKDVSTIKRRSIIYDWLEGTHEGSSCQPESLQVTEFGPCKRSLWFRHENKAIDPVFQVVLPTG